MIQTSNLLPQFESYLRGVLRRSERTISEYIKDLQYFVQWSALVKTSLDIRDVSEPIFLAYVSSMSKSELSPATIRRRVSSARMFFRWLSVYHGCENNPALRVLTPKIPVRLVTPAPAEIVRSYLYKTPASDKQREVRFAVAMMYACGLRLSEVLSLCGSDFDFYRSCVHVIGKGNKERIVPFSVSFRDLILDFVGGSLDPLFDNPCEATFRWAIINAVQFQGRGINPHQLRHLYAVSCLENGISLKNLSLLMGHANVKTTERYLSVDRQTLADVTIRYAPTL